MPRVREGPGTPRTPFPAALPPAAATRPATRLAGRHRRLRGPHVRAPGLSKLRWRAALTLRPCVSSVSAPRPRAAYYGEGPDLR